MFVFLLSEWSLKVSHGAEASHRQDRHEVCEAACNISVCVARQRLKIGKTCQSAGSLIATKALGRMGKVRQLYLRASAATVCDY
jgi:hypothetical protein